MRLSRGRVLKQSVVAQEPKAPAIATISYDEKPGARAIGTTALDLPPAPLRHDCVARDHEYVRHGTPSLLAGIDLLTGVVHASMGERHRSREFVGFPEKLNAAHPSSTAIKLILDNHSAHVSKETKAWLDTQPEGRFTFVLTPKHGSWLNLIEGFFSKLARSTLRHIRVASKKEQRRRRRDDFIGDRLGKRRREHKRSHEQPRDTVGSAIRMTRATCLGVQVAFRGFAKSASRRFSYEEASS